MRGGIVFHLPAAVLRDPSQLKPYYRRLTEGLRHRGIPADLVPHDRETILAEVAADRAFHIADHGSFRHPRLLNTGIAYVYPFWNLDPWGIRALSSIAALPFAPAALDPGQVAEFTRRLRRRLVGARISRYPQAQERADIPPGCIAVFLQSEAHRDVEETCHLGLREMVRAVLDRDDPRPVVIKPHPRDRSPETLGFLRGVAGGDPRVTLTGANIHDILARAAATVTINSAVGIESLLHRVPVVLCGRADFHHAAITVTRRARMAAALEEAMQRDWAHDAYLYWYFALNCINAGRETLVDDVLARIAATGFDPQGAGD